MTQRWYQIARTYAAIKKPGLQAVIIGGAFLVIAWLIGGLDAFLRGLSGALGVGTAVAVIVWLTKTFFEQKIKAIYESEKLAITHKQKIVETMVVQLHDFTKAYYMPMIAAVGGFSSYLNEGNHPYAFYSLIQYFLAHKHMRAEIHGYFLKDVVGERLIETLVVEFWHGHVLGNGFLKPGEANVVARIWEPDMSPQEFIEKIQGHYKLRDIYERFKDVAGDEEKKRNIILVGETLGQVFQLEVNLPYEAWYARVPSHIGTENLSLVEKQKSKLKEKQLTDEDIDNYIEKLKQFSW